MTPERYLDVEVTPADKAVSTGIQAVQTRLRVQGDGRPQLRIMRDARIERDELLVEARRPARTAEEIDGYVWDTANGRKKGEVPVDRDNHGMDAERYMVNTYDRRRVAFEPL